MCHCQAQSASVRQHGQTSLARGTRSSTSYLKPHSLKPVAMPRQNRVTPFGEIVAVPERGTMMGNRGRLHDLQGRIRRTWQVKRWLVCLLEFHGRQRTVMGPNSYTELFFLDEATGLAAGHRPCFECRRKAFEAFAVAFASGNRIALPTAGMIDERLHAERIGAKNLKKTFRRRADDLPEGTFVVVDGAAHLIWRGRLLRWSPGGYIASRRFSKLDQVTVLTPRSTVRAIRAGYRPSVHSSADIQ